MTIVSVFTAVCVTGGLYEGEKQIGVKQSSWYDHSFRDSPSLHTLQVKLE